MSPYTDNKGTLSSPNSVRQPLVPAKSRKWIKDVTFVSALNTRHGCSLPQINNPAFQLIQFTLNLIQTFPNK